MLYAVQAGGGDLEPEVFQAAGEVRSRLSEAARVKGALDAAARGLGKSGRQEEADALVAVSVAGKQR
jgi:hypothetical protein